MHSISRTLYHPTSRQPLSSPVSLLRLRGSLSRSMLRTNPNVVHATAYVPLLTNEKETLIRRYLLSEKKKKRKKKQRSHIFQFMYSFLCVANGRGRWLFLLAFSKETRDMFVSAYVLAARFKRKRRTRARTRVPLYTVFPAITYSYVDTNVVGVPSGEPVCRFPMFTNTHVY